MKETRHRLRALWASRWGVLAKVALSLAILLWFGLEIDYAALGRLLGEGRPVFLLVLVALTLLRTGIGVFRFRLLTDLLGAIPWRELLRQNFVAAYFNNFLPTALGGDAARVVMLAGCGLSKQQGAVLVLIERLMGFGALALLAAVGVLAVDVPPAVELAVVAFGLGYAGVTAALLAGRPAYGSLGRRFPLLARSWQALQLLSGSRRALLAVFATSIVYQVTTISLSWLVAVAVSIEVPFTVCLALVPLVWVLTMLPISLGGIGLREAGFVYFFGLVGVSTEASLLISLGTFAALLVNGLIGAAVFFSDNVLRRWSRTEDRPLPPAE